MSDVLELLPIALIIAVIAALFIVVNGIRTRKLAALLATGVPARGLVLEIARIGSNVSLGRDRFERREVLLDIEIPGQQPYEMRCSLMIPKLLVGSAMPGTFLDLRIDPADPKRLAVFGPGGIFFAD